MPSTISSATGRTCNAAACAFVPFFMLFQYQKMYDTYVNVIQKIVGVAIV